MTKRFNESEVERAAIDWLKELGYQALHGPDIAPGEPGAEREDFLEVLLARRVQTALARLNPKLPAEALEDAYRKLTRCDGPNLLARNRQFHRWLVDGLPVEHRRKDGSIGGAQVQLLDHTDPGNNDWLVVEQFTVIEDKHHRRPDLVVFVNGLPLAVIELKNAGDEKASIWSAFHQLQTYKQEIPALFVPNSLLLISDGSLARLGSLSADKERFMPWRTIDGKEPAKAGLPELQVLLQGVFEQRRFLDLIRHFIVFEEEKDGSMVKKLGGYHQFHAVNTALKETLRACHRTDGYSSGEGTFSAHGRGGERGDRRVGVVWHTQGSGKSLTMAFYAGRVILEPAMRNPTLVVLTDRNDLDEQLFGTFGRCKELLRQDPVRATDRADLRKLLKVDSGGVVFTTIHKFFPETEGDTQAVLSGRRNIVVIADEAHRSQYDFVDGFARHMRDALPEASFIGFTGTPIERADANTRAVFGDYISVYDIQRAVDDGATVPIYYEGRLAKLALKDEERPRIDPGFEEATEGEEVERKEKLKTKWAQLEALVGSEKRLGLIAEDLVRHFEQRLQAMDGKAMVVAMSRRIAVELYNALVALRPEWRDLDDTKGAIKVVMTGSASDPLDWQGHIRSKKALEALAKRFRDPQDPLKLVIVRDMWLTGFDAPCLHTLYMDKPMRGHGLMQAIARVNRVFKDKPGGLIVDYLGLADELRKALATYTEAGGKGKTALDQAEAIALMQEKYEVCKGILYGFDWGAWSRGTAGQRMTLISGGLEHVLAQTDGKNRFGDAVALLSKAFALAVPSDEALAIRDDVDYFQNLKATLNKGERNAGIGDEAVDHAIRQIVSRAVASEQVIDIFAAAGLKKPNVAVLSDEFLEELRSLPQKNLAVEMLRKLLLGEIKQRGRHNAVEGRSFSEMLERAMVRYQNRSIETAKVIEELIGLAKDLREASQRGEKLGLTEEELAFYDALGVNDSAVKVLGDENLRFIARELVESVRKNAGIDWTVRESVRAKLRVLVKRILKKYGYPPDLAETATQTVLEQAELFADQWSR